MAVLNPPRSLPGLGRAIVNYLLDARRTADRGRPGRGLQARGPEPGRRGRRRSEEHDLGAARDQRSRDGRRRHPADSVRRCRPSKAPFTKDQFRRVLQAPRLRPRSRRRRLGHPARRRPHQWRPRPQPRPDLGAGSGRPGHPVVLDRQPADHADRAVPDQRSTSPGRSPTTPAGRPPSGGSPPSASPRRP